MSITTQSQIAEWFRRGVANNATHLIVVCDTFDHGDYPVYVSFNQDAKQIATEYDGKNMQRVMEVYKLSDDMDEQLAIARCFRY